MRRALERQNFQVYYQPLVSLETGRISGFEALARWCSPDGSMLEAEQFIEAAEENPLFSGYRNDEPRRFSVREQVKSVCFIPIGTPKERLGAMFGSLNEGTPPQLEVEYQGSLADYDTSLTCTGKRSRATSPRRSRASSCACLMAARMASRSRAPDPDRPCGTP